MTLLVQGGVVVGPAGAVRSDLLIEGDTIVAVGGIASGGACHVVDATGCLIGPGLVDLHTHLRDPGQTWKEDIESGSSAAAAGGFTAVVAMPNTDPPIDDPKVASEVARKGDEVGLVKVVPAGTLTEGREGLRPAPVSELHRVGVRLFTDDGDSVADSAVLARAMREIATLGAVVAQHAEDRMGEETTIVARDLKLAAETGVRYHCQHLSSRGTVDLIREAKRKALPITAEVTPHHLSFTSGDASGGDANFKMYPPLRGEADRGALRQALSAGVIDSVATDHAPHLPEEKAVPFDEAPRGVIGLETAAAVVWNLLREPSVFFDRLSVAPARIVGLDRHGIWPTPGSPANLAVLSPHHSWVPGAFRSKSVNSPYRGRQLTGKVVATIYEGRISYRGTEP